MDHFRRFIVTNQIKDMKCPHEGCTSPKVTVKEVRAFVKTDKELLEKLNRFANEVVDLYTRFCIRPGCETTMRADSMDAKKLSCPTC
jgi:hypothetical protein